MLRLIGALLIGFSCAYLGHWGARQLKLHCQLLAGLQQGLLLLEKEINYAATPLPEALLQAAAVAGLAEPLFSQTAQFLQSGARLNGYRGLVGGFRAFSGTAEGGRICRINGFCSRFGFNR